MKKVLSIVTALAMAVSAGLFFSAEKAEAVPAFARQMKMPCKSCHFQHFPKLNAFGRAFKVNGYTDVAVDTINGDWGTSLPVNLNATYFTKIRYVKDVARDATEQSNGSRRGEWQVPDEGVLFVGGRVGEHIGIIVELADNSGLSWTNGSLVFGHDLESLNTHVGMTIWSTDSAGVFFGKDIFNTGLVRGLRNFENRDETQAAGVLYRGNNADGSINGDAWEGITWYANHEWFFAAVGLAAWGQATDFGADVSGTYRVGITPPQILGFDTMIGVYGQFGGTSWGGDTAGGPREDITVQANGMDFQAQGALTEGISLEVLANFLYDTDNPSARNYWTRGGQDYRRFNIGFDLGFLQDRLITKFNYLYTSARGIQAVRGDANWDRKSADLVSLGVYWNIRENVSLRPEISWVVGSDSCSTVSTCGMRRSGLGADTVGKVDLFFAF